MAILNLTESQKLWHWNLVLIMVIGILFIAKANPTSETFTCDENKVCKLEQKYVIPPLNRTKTYKLNLGCNLEPVEVYHSGGHSSSSYYSFHLGFDNKDGKVIKLFKQPSAITNGYHEATSGDPELKRDITIFEAYKKKPYIKYSAKSSAEEGDFAFWLYTWVIVMTVLILWNIFDKKKGTI